MHYKVVVIAEAEEDLNRFIQYLLFEKQNKHAAGSLKLCDNPRLESLGYHRINFQKHRYFMLYRIENGVVFVDDIFHELQDYENTMI